MIKTSRILGIILMLVIASASWTGAKADDFFEGKAFGTEVDGIYYYITEDNEAIVTNYKSESTGNPLYSNSYRGTVRIPEKIEARLQEYPVVGIQEYAFYGCPELTYVFISKSIRSVGEMAFGNCPALTSINVDNTSTNFFSDNGVLLDKDKSVVIRCPEGKDGAYTVPSSVTSIAYDAFSSCASLTSVTLPDGLTDIGNRAFFGCTALTSVNIPNTVITIGENAFNNCQALSSEITIPSGVMKIGQYAFNECTSLKKVNLNEGLTEIGTYAFYMCTSLKSISFPNSLSSIDAYAFAKTGLTSVNIPSQVTTIKAATFSECKLTSITLPSELEAILPKAFYNNGTTVSTLNIPASVNNIANNAFEGTTINNIYVNNIPRKTQIGATNPFKKVSGMKIHVFTLLDNAFKNAENWSEYADYIVADIQIQHVTSITLDRTTLTMGPDASYKLNATILPANAKVKDVVFTSSNPLVITITNDETGEFEACGVEGNATITCTAADGSGKFATCTVTVRNDFRPATSITLNKTNYNMNVGATYQLKATIKPDNATYTTATWKSSDVTIATVDANGNVTALAPGSVTITARSTDGYVSTTCQINVSYDTYVITDDGTDYTNNVESHVNTLTYKRKYKSLNWQCLYVPFDMSYDDWKDVIEVAIINNIHQYDNNNDGVADETTIELLYQRDGRTLKAHTPCMIRAKKTDSDNYQDITVSDVTLKKAEEKSLDCASVSTKFVFHGIYSKLSGSVMVENEYYSMSNGGFAKATDPRGDLRGLRWYLEIIDRTTGESSLAKTGNISIVAIDEEETTGITNIENGTGNKIVSIFDANGRKMNSFQKGLNIVKYSDGTTKKIMK